MAKRKVEGICHQPRGARAESGPEGVKWALGCEQRTGWQCRSSQIVCVKQEPSLGLNAHAEQDGIETDDKDTGNGSRDDGEKSAAKNM